MTASVLVVSRSARTGSQPAATTTTRPIAVLSSAAMLRPELLCEFRACLAGRLGLGVRLRPRLERLAEHGDAAYRIQAGERRSCLGLALGRRLDLDGQPIRRRRHGFAVGEGIARAQSRRAAHVPHRRKT